MINVLLVVLCKYCISLNISRIQSDACDLTERSAVSIGSGSVKVCKYSNYSGSFFAILKNAVRLRFDRNSVKSVHKTPVRFDSLVFRLRIINFLLCHFEIC